MKKIILINGPNLNLLGKREIEIYGDLSLDQIEKKVQEKSKEINISVDFFQTNSESEIINLIHKIDNHYDGLIINPAAFTHTSVAIVDALRATSKPKIEIHLSNIYAREDYRKSSITATSVTGTICGFGYMSYILAIEAIYSLLNTEQ